MARSEYRLASLAAAADTVTRAREAQISDEP
jgi:hypothetical protein